MAGNINGLAKRSNWMFATSRPRLLNQSQPCYPLNHQHLCPAGDQIPCWYNSLATGGYKGRRYNIKTRKLFTTHGRFHTKFSALRPYIKRWEGGQGLVSIRTSVQEENAKNPGTSPRTGCSTNRLRKWLIDKVYHTRQDPRSRLSKDASETEQHVTARCTMLAGKASLEHCSQVTTIVYRNICAKYGQEVLGLKWKKTPSVIENKWAVEIFYSIFQYTHTHTHAYTVCMDVRFK